MLLRTHLALTILVILLFLPHVSYPFWFIFITLIAALLPDIDTGYSTIGKMKGFWLLQFFVRHRGVLHSLTFCILISLIIALFLPVLSLGFFLGYSIHLFVDSFTKEGIMPFWPYRGISSWHFKTGSLTETTFFIILLVLDLIFAIIVLKNLG